MAAHRMSIIVAWNYRLCHGIEVELLVSSCLLKIARGHNALCNSWQLTEAATSSVDRHNAPVAGRQPTTPVCSHKSLGKLSREKRREYGRVHCKPDYSPSASDAAVFQNPPKEPLLLESVRNVFGYPRNVKEEYDFGKVLGSGSYGIVRKCINKKTGDAFAVKIIPKEPKRGNPCTPRYLLKLRNEVDMMRQLGASLNAVYLQSAHEDEKNVYLIMELCEGGSLLSRVSKGKETEKSTARVARAVLRFIAQCHARGIVYRDVKTENFLYRDESIDSSLKAIDFGLSIRHQDQDATLSSRTGTPTYMAPEVILQSYDSQCDLWSAGMMIFQLLTGRFFHWKDLNNTKLKDLWKSIISTPVDLETAYWKSRLSADARDFLSKLLEKDPIMRMTAAEALQHPWVREGGTARDMIFDGSVVQRLQRFATYGDLKQLILTKVSEEILLPAHNDDVLVEELKHLFELLDADDSGSISTDELAKGLRAQGYCVSDDEARQLLSKIDVDKSGYIDIDEFLATLVDWSEIENGHSEWDLYLDKIFSNIDKDGNGYISLDELIEYIPPNSEDAQDLGPNSVEAQARRMLREADTNKDGQISKEEFYALMRNTVIPDALEQYESRVT